MWYDAGVRYGGNHLLVYQINPLYISNSHVLYVNYISMRLENENKKEWMLYDFFKPKLLAGPTRMFPDSSKRPHHHLQISHGDLWLFPTSTII